MWNKVYAPREVQQVDNRHVEFLSVQFVQILIVVRRQHPAPVLRTATDTHWEIIVTHFFQQASLATDKFSKRVIFYYHFSFSVPIDCQFFATSQKKRLSPIVIRDTLPCLSCLSAYRVRTLCSNGRRHRQDFFCIRQPHSLPQIALKFGLHRSTYFLSKLLPQSDSTPVDLSVGDIRWQILAEWLEIAQWSVVIQWKAYRKPPLFFRMVPYDLYF